MMVSTHFSMRKRGLNIFLKIYGLLLGNKAFYNIKRININEKIIVKYILILSKGVPCHVKHNTGLYLSKTQWFAHPVFMILPLLCPWLLLVYIGNWTKHTSISSSHPNEWLYKCFKSINFHIRKHWRCFVLST